MNVRRRRRARGGGGPRGHICHQLAMIDVESRIATTIQVRRWTLDNSQSVSQSTMATLVILSITTHYRHLTCRRDDLRQQSHVRRSPSVFYTSQLMTWHDSRISDGPYL